MGCDTNIKLSPKATLTDVSKVIGVALGCKAREEQLGDGGIVAIVNGVSTGKSSVAECAEISVHNSKWFLYHFEFGSDGHRGLLPRSRPLNICIGKRLIAHFGGEIIYNDLSGRVDEYNSAPDKFISAEDGEEWNKRQRKILETPVITEAEVREAAKHAVHNDEETIEEDIEILRKIKGE